MKKIKNSQPQTKFTGSYKKKSVVADAQIIQSNTEKQFFTCKPDRKT